MNRPTLADLPRRYQEQAGKQLYNQKQLDKRMIAELAPLPYEEMPIPATPKALGSPIRQKQGDGLNKLERAFLGHLKAEWEGEEKEPYEIRTQEITLKIANGCRYTPDFVVIKPWAENLGIEAYEVKGFMRDDAAVKLKVAASLYHWIAFHLVTRKKGAWTITPVLP